MAWLRTTPEPILAGLCYALSSTCLTLVNKYVFSRRQFHYPWFTLAFQNLISILLIHFLNYLPTKTSKKTTYHSKLSKELRIPILFFIIFIFSNAQALRHMNLPILTVFKSLGPMGVTLFEHHFFHDKFPPQLYFSMSLIVLSAFITAFYDLQFTPLGYFWASINVISNILYLASLRYYVSNKYTSLEKTFHSNLLSLIPIIPISILMREIPIVFFALQNVSTGFLVAYVLSGVLTLGICGSAFWCITTANGSTLSFIGGFNKIPIVILGAILFETKISLAGWIGVAFGLLAGIVFVRVKSMGREDDGGKGRKETMLKAGEETGIDLSKVSENGNAEHTG